MRPKLYRQSEARCPSVEFERGLVILLKGGVLVFFAEEAVADGERFNSGAHEAVERVLRRAHDGFAAHIETGIDDDGAAGQALEGAEQRVIARVGFLVHGLDARRDNDRPSRGVLDLAIFSRESAVRAK